MADGKFQELNRLTPTSMTVFTCLSEAKGFKGGEDDKTWNITVSMSHEVGTKFIKECEVIAEALRKDETERRASINRQTRDIPAVITHKTMSDGSIVFNFKKKAKNNTPPLVVDYNRNPTNPKILPGTKVQVAYNLRPYVMSSTNIFGVQLQLVAVRTMDHNLPDEEVQGIFSNAKLAESNKKDDEINLDDLF